MLKKAIIALMAIGVFILVGCGTAEVEKADSIEDIVGTWQRVGGSSEEYFQFSDEGTYLFSDSLDKINDGSGQGYLIEGEFWFEDTQYFDNNELCNDQGPDEIGVYEILLLESGNFKFELIEDNCLARKTDKFGAFSTEGKIEWEPVP